MKCTSKGWEPLLQRIDVVNALHRWIEIIVKTRNIYEILKKVNNVQCTPVGKSSVLNPHQSVLTLLTERVGIKMLV